MRIFAIGNEIVRVFCVAPCKSREIASTLVGPVNQFKLTDERAKFRLCSW